MMSETDYIFRRIKYAVEITLNQSSFVCVSLIISKYVNSNLWTRLI
jgi:hypothetical protein